MEAIITTLSKFEKVPRIKGLVSVLYGRTENGEEINIILDQSLIQHEPFKKYKIIIEEVK